MEQENSCLVTCLGTLNKKNQKTTYFRTETEILQYKHHEKMQFEPNQNYSVFIIMIKHKCFHSIKISFFHNIIVLYKSNFQKVKDVFILMNSRQLFFQR